LEWLGWLDFVHKSSALKNLPFECYCLGTFAPILENQIKKHFSILAAHVAQQRAEVDWFFWTGPIVNL
jgi:hypothetical protein